MARIPLSIFWTLFPRMLLYTLCVASPNSSIFDIDGKVVSEVKDILKIKGFPEAKFMASLEAFPLRNHR